MLKIVKELCKNMHVLLVMDMAVISGENKLEIVLAGQENDKGVFSTFVIHHSWNAPKQSMKKGMEKMQ